MRTADFDFHLPQELIAQHPAPQRDQSRLLVLRRCAGTLTHERFSALPGHLTAGDVLVLNDTRVIPARLRGTNVRTGGVFEVLLLEENAPNDWWALVRPGKRARVGAKITLRRLDGQLSSIQAEVLDKGDGFRHRLRFEGTPEIGRELDGLGEMPLPPYIERPTASRSPEDKERYQTVFATAAGSAAAPTAGLHFTTELLEKIRAKGVQVCFVTLRVGLATFAPVRVENLAEHVMHEEWFSLGEATATAIHAAKKAGRRVVAVGTTSVRVLESVAAQNDGRIVPTQGRTRIFIHPPYRFRVVDALVTNFHLPCSTLLMLVSAFAAPGETRGRETVLNAYAEAIRERYRFFSYGDAMLIL
jgi:S-adenosylmethionine:tRNA ribosyltransferase-isomerase